jgi:hypothetical protein
MRASGPALQQDDAAAGETGAAESAATRFTQPLLCLVLWAALLHSEGRIDARLLRHLGADAETLEALYAQHPQEIEQLRWLRLAGMLFSRESLGALLKARIGELLMGATKASEILALTKALERMPEWIWGADELSAASWQLSAGDCAWGQAPLPAHTNQQAQGPAATRDELEAMQLLREMLDKKYDATSPEEINGMLLRAQALADRLDDYGIAMRPGHKPTERKVSYTKKRARPRR